MPSLGRFQLAPENPNSGGQYEAGQAGKIDRDHAVPRPLILR
jgi:hypothetical protein